MTKTFKNPLEAAHTPELIISFSPEVKDPINATFAAGQVWSADLASVSSLFWKEDSNIIDVGSNMGAYAVLAASFTKGKVIAIEPDPHSFGLLLKNKENNNFHNLECHNFAASDKSGSVDFQADGSGGSHISSAEHKGGISVPAKTLDSLLGNTKIDFIKIDVEGWEINVLDGLAATIERDSPPIVFEVNGFTLKWFDVTPNDLIRKLEDFGYRVFVIAQKMIPINSYEPFPFGVVDCFALKDEHIATIAPYLALPLSSTDRKSILEQSHHYSNVDMKAYFEWYRAKINL